MEAASLAARVSELERRMAAVEESLTQLSRKKHRRAVVVAATPTPQKRPPHHHAHVTPGESWLQSRAPQPAAADDSPPTTPTPLPSSVELDASHPDNLQAGGSSSSSKGASGVTFFAAQAQASPTTPTPDAAALLVDLDRFRRDLADVSKDISFCGGRIIGGGGGGGAVVVGDDGEHPRTALIKQRRAMRRRREHVGSGAPPAVAASPVEGQVKATTTMRSRFSAYDTDYDDYDEHDDDDDDEHDDDESKEGLYDRLGVGRKHGHSMSVGEVAVLRA